MMTNEPGLKSISQLQAELLWAQIDALNARIAKIKLLATTGPLTTIGYENALEQIRKLCDGDG